MKDRAYTRPTFLALMTGVLLAGACVSTIVAQEEPTYIWFEGEAPKQTVNFDVDGHRMPHELLSGGEALHYSMSVGPEEKDPDAPETLPPPERPTIGFQPEPSMRIELPEEKKAQVPEGGFQALYEFEAREPGDYRLWMRIGFDRVRAPLDWRIDDGEWQTVEPHVWLTDLTELYTWTQIMWADGGIVKLDAGTHTLQVKADRPNGKRLLFMLDCFALTPDLVWRPEQTLKPGETYDKEIDRQAAETVYTFDPERNINAAPGRSERGLWGLWQVARFDDPDMDGNSREPVRELPDLDKLHWMGINVPGSAYEKRKELALAHRIVYRTKLDVPSGFDGRGFKIHFSGTNWIASVFVNGQFCGWQRSVLVPWDVDVTRAVVPGRVNEIAVVIKDSYYGLDDMRKTLMEWRSLPTSGEFHRGITQAGPFYPSSKGEGNGLQTGLVNDVHVWVTGRVYTSDVFVRTSVRDSRLDADVSVLNPGERPVDVQIRCDAVHDRTGEVEKRFELVRLTVPAGEQAIAAIGGEWPDAKFWWPAEEYGDWPDCYRLRTTVSVDGRPVDVHEQLFGFREVWAEGRDFMLNGVPWHFWNWVDVGPLAHTDEDKWLRAYFAQNDRFHRFSGDHDRHLGWREKALEFHDRHGIPGRLSTCIDGMFISHNLRNPKTWDAFEEHARQVVRAYRNHPSIMHWSLGNELMLVTARNAYNRLYDDIEKIVNERIHLSAKELDPTRMAYQDGGGDLGGPGEINCQHYSWGQGQGFPTGAYSYPISEPVQPRSRQPRELLYIWDCNKPLIFGEVFYAVGNLGRMAWIGGPQTYRGQDQFDQAAARYARVCLEGARWQRVMGICPWTILHDANKSFESRAVFLREHNSCHWGGSILNRTMAVFLEGRKEEHLVFKWRVEAAGKVVAAGQNEYEMKPGTHVEDVFEAALPVVSERTDGRLVLELYNAGGACVFEDSKPLSVLPPPKGPLLKPGVLAVYDPDGSATTWLDRTGQAYAKVTGLGRLPKEARILLVGRNALPEVTYGGREKKPQYTAERDAATKALTDFVASGNVVLCLEQAHPLESGEIPVQGVYRSQHEESKLIWAEFARAGGAAGSVAFPIARNHGILSGMRDEDFFTWAGETDEVFGNGLTVPISGACNLVVGGGNLEVGAAMELPLADGSLVLSQLLIGAKLDVEPAAGALLANMLRWAGSRVELAPGTALLYAAGDGDLESIMWATGTDFKIVDDIRKLEGVFSADQEVRDEDILGGLDDLGADDLGGLGEETPDIEVSGRDTADARAIIMRGSDAALAWLLRNKAHVRKFCERGGWVMVCNVDRRSIDEFGKFVDVQHRIRDYYRSRTYFTRPDDALLDGVTNRELNQLSDMIIAPWMKLRSLSEPVFTSIVDADDNIGPFARRASTNMFNGLTSRDFWHYIQYLSMKPDTSVDLDFGRPEKIKHINIWLNRAYNMIKDVRIVLDDDESTARELTLAQTADKQVIEINRRCARISIVILNHHKEGAKGWLTGIDDMQVIRELPDDVARRAVPLTWPAGIVKYPVGKGGVVLNQLDYASADNFENVDKKRCIYSNLVRNMGVAVRPANVVKGFRPRPRELELKEPE